MHAVQFSAIQCFTDLDFNQLCVCVCVCVLEREREREREMRERERERERDNGWHEEEDKRSMGTAPISVI